MRPTASLSFVIVAFGILLPACHEACPACTDSRCPEDIVVRDVADVTDQPEALLATESCNGRDDDGDGLTDEGFDCAAGAPVLCRTACGTTGVGRCDPTCHLPAAADCTPVTETCNGRDDDCNGTCDDGFACCAGATVPCGTACGSVGRLECDASCRPGTCRAPEEACNGHDDDCDGMTDEGFPCVAGAPVPCTTSCGSHGTATCTAGCAMGTCTPPPEVCANGVDDDCDGTTDTDCVPGDACGSPLVLGDHATGDTTGAGNDAHGTCGGDEAPEVYLAVDLDAASDVFVSSSGSSFDTVLYAGRACGGSELACQDDAVWSTARWSTLALPALPMGRTFITVDGYGTEAGAWRVAAWRSRPGAAGDRCGHPRPVPAPAEGSSTSSLDVDLCGLGDDLADSCSGAGRNDAVLWFAVTSAGTVRVAACGTDPLDARLHLRRDCDDATTEEGCATPVGACATVEGRLEDGLHFIVLEGPATGCGTVRVTVTWP